VRICFRSVFDSGYTPVATAWFVDDIALAGSTNEPFLALHSDQTPCAPVAVGDATPPSALSFAVAGANPARGAPSFRFALPNASRVTIALIDVSGRRIATLADGDYPAGVHTTSWSHGSNERPRAGLYFARMRAGGKTLDQRIVVLGN
jgi:hypothetical protein